MVNFPTSLDDDSTLLRVDNNITEIGSDAINALRAAVFAIEADIGIGAAGTAGSIAQRFNTSFDGNGNILPSVLLAAVANLQITDAQVSPAAAIQESKLFLNYPTATLYDLIVLLQGSVDVLNGFLSLSGVKLEPHIDGTNYNHLLSAIFVDTPNTLVKNSPSTVQISGTNNYINRNNANLLQLAEDFNNDLVAHEKADGTGSVTAETGGTIPPIDYAHNASGVYVNPGSFTAIPEALHDVQSILDFIDSSSLLLLGSRIQTFYSNGISRTGRSSSLLEDGYGQPIIPPTPVIAYFLDEPFTSIPSSSPVDDINHGDDVIVFQPTASQLANFNFDEQFGQVSAGDLLTINYGTGLSFQFVVESTKASTTGRTYAVRINGRNPFLPTGAVVLARIDRPVFNRNKQAVLATGMAPNNLAAYPTLISINPRSAMALGGVFDPSQLDSTHYNLYLSLLPTGTASLVAPTIPPIDVTGNQGATPGAYTLNSVIDAINTFCRQPGINYRFLAFEYEGNIGIALADPYNNASFTIVSDSVDSNGNYTTPSGNYPNNVIDNFNLVDPLGMGLLGSNVASPPPNFAYTTALAAFISPTLVFAPLKRNNYYVDGSEKDKLKSDPLLLNSSQDTNGDGFWPATITNVGPDGSNPTTVPVTYTTPVGMDLSGSGLEIGKTLVVQPLPGVAISATDVYNYGRFTISNIAYFHCDSQNAYATITVYDAVHAFATQPYTVPPATFTVGTQVALYFCDDSIFFDAQNIFDSASAGPYKRFFEAYIDGNGHTITHERARFLASLTQGASPIPPPSASDILNINLYNVSPKLTGFYSNTINNNGMGIQLFASYNNGYLTAFLQDFSGNAGVSVTKPQGSVMRLYAPNNVDYIEIMLDLSYVGANWSTESATIQIFPTLRRDWQFMLLATCQIDDRNFSVSHVVDRREFGNISEEIFSDSAINLIEAAPRYTSQNGVLRGFNFISQSSNMLKFTGGLALVNGKFLNINSFTVEIPPVKEYYASTVYNSVQWVICINDQGEVVILALTDLISGGPPTSSRLVYVFNPSLNPVTSSYIVPSETFSNIVDNRKDLLAIYTTISTMP